MNLIEFVKKYSGKKVDFDGAFGAQCVDLFRQYCKDVLQIPHTGAVNGARELYENYDSMPGEKKYFFRVPAKEMIFESGDVAVWGASKSNKYGHVAIVITMYDGHLIVFEQDGFKLDGAKISVRSRENFLGVLRPYPKTM